MIRRTGLWLKTFAEDESGVGAIELLFMTPILMWIFVATLSYFDAYRAKFAAHKANTVLADMVSRETVPLTPTYIDGMLELFESLADRNDDASIRITVVMWDEASGEHQYVWSRARGSSGVTRVQAAEIDTFSANLPLMGDQDQVIVVETFSEYNPRYGDVLVNILDMFEIETYSVISPRFVGQVCYEPDASTTICTSS